MRTRNAVLIVSLAAVGLAPASAQEDLESKKKRLAEFFKQKAALMKKTEENFALRQDPATQEKWEKLSAEGSKFLEELSGGDRQKRDDLSMEVLKKHAPELIEYFEQYEVRRKNHRWGTTMMRVLGAAERDFFFNDRDRNGVKDFWVKDVSGLCRISVDGTAAGKVDCIPDIDAAGDVNPCVPLYETGRCKLKPEKESVTLIALKKEDRRRDYRFLALEKYEDKDGKWVPYDPGNGRHAAKFGFAAVPSGYPKTALYTLIVSEEGTAWAHDTAGKPPAGFPADPAKGGWEKLE